MIALLAVADQYGLNPFLKEIYAFPDKGGIVPVVGVDGWARMMNDHLQFDGIEFVYSDKIIESPEHQPVPEWCECVIYRKDRRHPTRVREWFNEVYRKPIVKSDGKVIAGPWQTHTKRFFRHKTMIQGNRLAFGFTGIYEPDEAERIRESRVIDITPTRDDVTDLNTELGLLTDGTDERPAEE
jgi:phage recombination protein Bet